MLSLGVCNQASAQLQLKDIVGINNCLKNREKPLVVFIYTDWCKYCQLMKKTTFKDPDLVKALNENFQMIFFNAEEKREVKFGSRTYKYIPHGLNTGFHSLAELIGEIDGGLSFPSICVLDAGSEVLFQEKGFIEPAYLLKVLKAISSSKRLVPGS